MVNSKLLLMEPDYENINKPKSTLCDALFFYLGSLCVFCCCFKQR
jgi:hypothetical protein